MFSSTDPLRSDTLSAIVAHHPPSILDGGASLHSHVSRAHFSQHIFPAADNDIGGLHAGDLRS